VRSANITRCPLCGGDVHAVAGRCKHCKQDLVELRARQALAAAPPAARPSNAAPGPAPAPAAGPPPSAPVAPAAPAPRSDPAAGTPPNGTAAAGTRSTARPEPAARNQPAPAPAPAPRPAPIATRPPRVRGSWWNRWPLVAGGAALFLLGLAAGMMFERSRAAAPASEPIPAAGAATPRPMPEPMPTTPLPLPTPAPAPAPDDLPGAPAAGIDEFTTRLGATLCDKAVDCGLFPASNRGDCVEVVDQGFDPDAASRVAAGECRFDRAAAAGCLEIIDRLGCDAGAGIDTLLGALSGKLRECERAFQCR
jgi:hypothetical protein